MFLANWIFVVSHLRMHWMRSTILKTSIKSVWSTVFWYVKVCIFWTCVQYTIHRDKTQMLKEILFGENKRYKKCPLFFCELQLITVSLLICDSYMSSSTRFVSRKLCVGFSVFDSVLFLLKFICLTKCMNSLTLKHHNSFQN